MENNKKGITGSKAEELYYSAPFIPINREAIFLFGVHTALFLSNLLDHKKFLRQTGKGLDGWFFYTHEEQMKKTYLSARNIQSAKKELKRIGILHTEMRGIPAKEWYFIDMGKLLHFLEIEY